jgi:bacillithiol biosynthesis deacetylase BshB1
VQILIDITKIPAEQIDVVAIGAHPDDTELGCGGTLAKLAKSGLKVGIIDLTNAEPTPLNDKYRSPNDFEQDYGLRRINESKCAASKLGLTSRVTLDLPNRRLFDNFETRCELATILRLWKPKIAMVMYGKTVMASPDHYQAQLIVEAALFYSRLTKWESYMGNLPIHRLNNLLYFPIRRAGFLNPQGETGNLTSFFVDISDVIDAKKEAILCYESQFQDQNKTDFVDSIMERNREYGRLVKVQYAEHLASPNPLLINDFSLFFQSFF